MTGPNKRTITLPEGAGGELMQELLGKTIIPHIRPDNNQRMEKGMKKGIPPGLLDDSATSCDVAFTIDGHTIWPLEFPGGDIGSLAVFGTVNDLCVVGASPRSLALSLVIEEGLERELLERIARSIGISASKAGVEVITGDTKVVEAGGVKGIIATTSGIGPRHPKLGRCLDKSKESSSRTGLDPEKGWLRDDLIDPGDHIILSGSVGDHGISVLSFREGYGFDTEVISDLAPMVGVMDSAIGAGGIVAAKDLTRGGLANGLNEWTFKSGVAIEVEADRIPVKGPVRSACEMLGLDPYEIGNEGKVILAAADGSEEEVLKAVRSVPEGRDAEIIGRARKGKARVVLETEVGGKRIMDPPYGDPVPRIC